MDNVNSPPSSEVGAFGGRPSDGKAPPTSPPNEESSINPGSISNIESEYSGRPTDGSKPQDGSGFDNNIDDNSPDFGGTDSPSTDN